MDKPYDYFVTRAWEAIVGRRRSARSHVSLAIPALEADFAANPGPVLPSFAGIVGEAAAEALVVGESETGYLTVDELISARVKFHVYLRQYLIEGRHADPQVDVEGEASGLQWARRSASGDVEEDGGRERAERQVRKTGVEAAADAAITGYPDDACLLVVAERVTEAVIVRGLRGVEVTRPEPGLWFSSPGFRMYIISTEELAFRDETAALHLLCRGPHMARALEWLVLHEDTEALECGRHLSEVVEAMNTTSRQEFLTKAEREEVHRLFLAKEAAQLEKGKREGKREAVLALWLYRFGAPAPWVFQRVEGCKSSESLDAILKDVALATDIAIAEEAVRARLGNGRE